MAAYRKGLVSIGYRELMAAIAELAGTKGRQPFIEVVRSHCLSAFGALFELPTPEPIEFSNGDRQSARVLDKIARQRLLALCKSEIEYDIAALHCDGLSDLQIASRLCLSRLTTKRIRDRVLDRCGGAWHAEAAA